MTVRRIVVLAMATALMAAGIGSAGQSKGGKPLPPPAVTADFRAELGDKVTADGAAYPASNGTEGAFINSNGGLTISLQPGGLPDRTMWFDFSAPMTDWSAKTCNRGRWLGTSLDAAQVILGLNAVNSAGAVVGLQSLTSVGASAPGTGTINFYSGTTGDPYFWTLRFNKNVRVTRTGVKATQGADTWTIEWNQQPGGYATLQCTTIKRPTVIADDSTWVMPFKITVTALQ
jgi:hypothetical protein